MVGIDHLVAYLKCIHVPPENSSIVGVRTYQRQGASGLEPTPLADLGFILHGHTKNFRRSGLRCRRFRLEPVCAFRAAENAFVRTIYFGRKPIDLGSLPGICRCGECSVDRNATVVALVLRADPRIGI